MLMSLRVLPTRISFPSLAHCLLLLGPVPIPETILVEALVDSLSTYEAGIMQKAPAEASTQTVFLSWLMPELLGVLSNFDCRQMPMPQSFFKCLVNIAIYRFLTKPCAALEQSTKESLKYTTHFGMEVNCLHSIYQAQVSPAMVLKMIEDMIQWTLPKTEYCHTYVNT